MLFLGVILLAILAALNETKVNNATARIFFRVLIGAVLLIWIFQLFHILPGGFGQ